MANPERVTQVAIEAIIATGEDPTARLTQVVAEVAIQNTETPTARLTQVTVEVLITPPTPEVTPEIIHTFMPTDQAHRFATLWKIERTDGTIFRFTDHNTELDIGAFTYTPLQSLQSTARQKQSGLNDNNFSVRGVVDSSVISHNDLMLGLFQGAQVSEYLVDWRYPWAGYIMASLHWIQKTTWDGEIWRAEMVGVADKLKKPRGDVYNRVCRHTLGNSECTFVISSLMAVNQQVDVILNAHTSFRPRSLDDSYGKANGWYDYGWAEWRSGANEGTVSEIKTWDGDDHSFVLALPTIFPIQVGDNFDIVPGCDKTLSTCISKFSNIDYFGGFPSIPGPDRMLQTPESGILGKLGFD